jgi:hypothetical protein
LKSMMEGCVIAWAPSEEVQLTVPQVGEQLHRHNRGREASRSAAGVCSAGSSRSLLQLYRR